MKNIIKNILASLDNHNIGYSGRKLSALGVMLTVLIGHFIYYKHCFTKEDFSIFATVLCIDYCAIAFFLGLVTAEQLIKLRNDKPTDEPTDSANNG